MTRRVVALALLSLTAGGCAEPPGADVLLVRSADSSPANWGVLPELLGARARTEARSDGTLPAGDLSRFRLILITTNLNVFEGERRRLWEYVSTGGKLVTWFADDRRASPTFFPYKLILSDDDPAGVTFRNEDHPLLKGLRGKAFTGQQYGGDVARDWDRDQWRVLADSPRGPAMLLCEYGSGAFLDVQFHVPLSSRRDVVGPLADNLLVWAGVAPLDPAALARRSVCEVVLAVADRQVRPLAEGDWRRGSWEQVSASRPPAGLAWSYPWGVTLYGMMRVAEVTGVREPGDFALRHNALVARQADYLQWQRGTFGRHAGVAGLGELVRLSSLDDCGSMASQVAEGLLTHPEAATPEATAMLRTVADYITRRQSRLPDGSLCRGRTLWVDDLYMSCPFLARWGTMTGEARYWDDAARQVIQSAARLQDRDGLWFHGWFDREGRTSGWKWGRGNGWALLSEVEVLSQLPEGHPDRSKLLDILRRHLEGLKQVQAPSGLWRQVLDQPDLWEETSCTGMFAFALARACNRGWVDRANMPVARKAFEGLKPRVTWDGSVLGTCAGTGIGRRLRDYRERPQPTNDPHGPGPVMLAGAELLAAGEQ